MVDGKLLAVCLPVCPQIMPLVTVPAWLSKGNPPEIFWVACKLVLLHWRLISLRYSCFHVSYHHPDQLLPLKNVLSLRQLHFREPVLIWDASEWSIPVCCMKSSAESIFDRVPSKAQTHCSALTCKICGIVEPLPCEVEQAVLEIHGATLPEQVTFSTFSISSHFHIVSSHHLSWICRSFMPTVQGNGADLLQKMNESETNQ